MFRMPVVILLWICLTTATLFFQNITVAQESFIEQFGTFTDKRDGQNYKWVRIGNQIWMAENLNIGTPLSGKIDQSDNNIIEKYCYKNDLLNCIETGGLYQWGETMNYMNEHGVKGICPEGWHVPSIDDFLDLDYSLDENYAGIKLKAEGHYYKDPDCYLIRKNLSGFSALLSGVRRYKPNDFAEKKKATVFWSSTPEKDKKSQYKGNGAHRMKLHRDKPTVEFARSDKTYAFSIRCLKD